MVQANGKTLKKIGGMPYPKDYVVQQLGNKLIYDELNYDKNHLHREYVQLYATLTDEQRVIFHKITDAVKFGKGGVFFLYGYGGTGKTFMWRTLAAFFRSKGEIVLTAASSGIASLLIPGGRRAHSKFKIPVPTMENSTCNLDGDGDHAHLFQQTKLIIWDEAPMCHKYCFETLDRTLQDVMSVKGNSDLIFGGKVVVFGGDFRQILPVIPRGSRSDIVHSSINASYIWDHCEVLTLTKNMRLNDALQGTDSEEVANFSKWILKVGEGKLSEPNDGNAEIEIPEDLLIPTSDNPIKSIVDSTYPNFLQNFADVSYLDSKAILASTIEVVDEINDYMLSIMPGEQRDYLSSNSVDMSDVNDPGIYEAITPEFLNSLRTSGLPNHHIKLKIGTPIMLMRNLDQAEGLCNGTRLIITKMADHVIEGKIMSGKHAGNVTYIARMTTSPSQSPWPFKLSRTQFPIVVSYAMTINKVKSKKGLKILINNGNSDEPNSTTNVVFKEIFHNL
ncbi:unnamed protein product [Trifolium pratense]|uniref:Uncharacterized protein n=1 Tax=Trifolium pratense TaxID=57577 RepID=A0ACB0LTZ9_TRIPR|nr:unnamed protein product [Trifolium pratense]